MIDRRLAEDVLFAFSVEPQHDRQTLENYLRRYPELAEELIDLSHEFRLVAELGESETEVADGEGRRRLRAAATSSCPRSESLAAKGWGR